MFNAKVFLVSIPSSGVALEEEHIAREVIARWNVEEGEKHGVAYLTVTGHCTDVTPDIYVFAIDNYLDEQKVEAAIATGAKVLLSFRSHHDEKNTMESEVKAIEVFRSKVQDKCVCIDYNSKSDFEETLTTVLYSN